MCRHAVVAIGVGLLVVISIDAAPLPLKLTIDCSSRNKSPFRSRSSPLIPRRGVASFCDLVHRSIPQAIRNGRFLIEEPDQTGFGNEQINYALPPPRGFIPKLYSFTRLNPKLTTPKLRTPKLKIYKDLKAPRVASSKLYSPRANEEDEESSAERMERFKKTVQKMLYVVKVMGQIDQYISERTRIIIDVLSKTFADSQ